MKTSFTHLTHRFAATCAMLGLLAPLHAADVTILDDDFSGLRPGMFSSDVIGAQAEYHYLNETAPQGNWRVAAFRSDGSQRAWRVVRADGRLQMYQSYTSGKNEAGYTHPMIVAGEPLWRDYTTTVQFTPEANRMQSGMMFRYHNSRCYYFFGLIGDKAVLKAVNHATKYRGATEKVLAQQPFAWRPGMVLTATVTVSGSAISGDLNGTARLQASDTTFPSGRIGLTSDVPTHFERVNVTMAPAAAEALHVQEKAREAELAKLEAANPKMVVWKKLATDGFGTGRQLRFGDLDGDGQLDILVVQVQRHGPKDRNSEVGCLTALTLDGKRLWQVGEADPWNDLLTNDVAVQICDIDQDGRNEVIYTRNLELVIADGATGKVKRKIPTPDNHATAPYDRFPRVLGDAIAIGNFRGRKAPQDIVLKDRYQQFWVFTDQLDLLWSGTCNTGHYPYPTDIDGDGKDELYIGYSLYAHDGKKLWSLDDKLDDHADGVSAVDLDLDPTTPPVLINAASDEGMVYLDPKGNITRHYYLGHVQNPSTANFRDDLPGLETFTVNFWGNQGIIHLFDARGELVFDFEPAGHGSMMVPANWSGRSEEYFILSANSEEGGLFDGRGRRVVRFPADGHPQLANAALDLTGDCRDEIVVWDANEIWIYTQNDSPKAGRLYRPIRTPLWRESNYGAAVSLPGWSAEK
jgi:rhamnogalacturonan endolyase